jgi:transcriptional regulator with XRE-family HTH domain
VVEFGATLSRLRRNANKSTVALARALNLEVAYVERLERGDARPPDRQFVLDLAQALGLPEAQTDELLWSANHLPYRLQPAEPREVRTVALFVDHENIYIALSELLKNCPPDVQAQERRKVETSFLAQTLRTQAERLGWLKIAMTVADWERLPTGQVKEYLKLRYQVEYNLPGRNNADLKLSDAIRNVLEQDEDGEIDTYVLVTGDGGYLSVLDTLLRRQRQVHIWGVRGATNAVLQQNASSTAWIEDILGLNLTRQNGSFEETNGAKPVQANLGDTVRIASGYSFGNDVSRLEAMAIHLSRYLRLRSWSFITFVRFLGFLSETGVFGASREEQLAWLSHAKETGVLREEILDDPNDSTRIARRFSLNELHPLVVRAQAIRARVGDVVPSGGRGLAFGVVIDRLISDPELQLTDVQAKNWLTWLTDAGYLLAETVPHYRKEGVTVTLVRQAPGYWEAPVVNDPVVDTDRLDGLAEQATVRLADFLERHPHFAWMALSQLLNQMTETQPSNGPDASAMNRQRAKQAVAMANERGFIAVDQIPNLKTGGTTTVARLNRDQSRVAELLTLREALVRRLAEMLVSRSSVSRGLFQASVVDKLGLSYEDAGAWIDLMVTEGLFALDTERDLPSGGALRVDHQDLIVSRILFSPLQPPTDVARSSDGLR